MEHKKIRVLFVGNSDITVNVIKVLSRDNIMRSKFIFGDYEVDFKLHNIEKSFTFDNHDYFDGVFYIDYDAHYRNLYYAIRECNVQSRVSIMNDNSETNFLANTKWFNETKELCVNTNTKLFLSKKDDILVTAFYDLINQIELNDPNVINIDGDLNQIAKYISYLENKLLAEITSYVGYKPSVTDKNFKYALDILIDDNDDKAIRQQFAILSTKINRVSAKNSRNVIVWSNIEKYLNDIVSLLHQRNELLGKKIIISEF